MKNRVISVILLLALLLSLCPQVIPVRVEAAGTELSQGQQNIVKRARQMVDIQWTPKKNIAGWRYEYTYYAGTTYTGLPYGQPVNASYVPWETSLEDFLAAVNDSGSKMYTSYSAYTARAPYYSVDCSGFVSWAWDLPSRQPSSSLAKYGTKISSSSYKNAQVGDCLLDPGVHAALITDITYDSKGNITAIEVSDAGSSSGCRSRWYGEGNGYRTLDYFVKAYFKSGYSLYRSKTRDSVTYTHSCAIPLKGDNCSKCGVGNGTDDPISCVCSVSYAGTYICTATTTGLAIRGGHGTSYSKVGTIAPGAKVIVTAANGKWAHVEYNGVSGYASMDYLKLQYKAPSVSSCGCSDSYAGTYICTATSGTLNIRSGHGTSYSKIGTIGPGAKVTVTAANGKWAHVEYNGVSGYAAMDYLKLQYKAPSVSSCDCSDSYAGTYICTATSGTLNIRSGHGTSYSKIGTIGPGAKVTVIAANGKWAHVEYNGVSGYASMDFLKLQYKAPSASSCDCSDSYAGTYICTATSGTLNIRSGHGTSYSKVGTIGPGAKVTVTAANGKWAHVEYNGVSGYASMDYLKPQEETVLSCGCFTDFAGTYICTATSGTLNIRSGHGTSYSKVGTIGPGAKVTVIAANGKWAHVEYNGVSGYASMDYLKPQEETVLSCGCSTDFAGTYICTATSGTLNIRSGHGTSYSKIGTIAPGAKVTVTAVNGKWAHVEYNGISGYASMDYLKSQEETVLSCGCSTDFAGTYICTATTTGLAIRGGHGTSYTKVGTIAPGARVTVIAANGKWAHVEYNGVSGYASMDYLIQEN